MRILAWFGIVAPVVRLSLIAVLGYLQPGYSQSRDFISELGAAGAPYAWLMNSVGIAAVGLLLFGFGYALWRALKPGKLIRLGAVALSVAGLSFIAVGIFPCDAGCSMGDPSQTMRLHLLAGTSAMFMQTFAPLLIGAGLLIAKKYLRYAVVSIFLGSLAIMALGVLFSQNSSFENPGSLQKTFQASTDVWVFLSAMVVLRVRTKVHNKELRSE
jgi:hypothetical membrane protein